MALCQSAVRLRPGIGSLLHVDCTMTIEPIRDGFALLAWHGFGSIDVLPSFLVALVHWCLGKNEQEDYGDIGSSLE